MRFFFVFLIFAFPASAGGLRDMDLAWTLSQRGDSVGAIAIYEEVFAADPGNLHAATELCALYTEARDDERAGTVCRKAVALDPESPVLNDNLGLYHFKFGRFSEALAPFLKALSPAPASATVKSHLLQAYMAMGEDSMARDYAEDFLRDGTSSDADGAFLSYTLYLACRRLKDYGPAFTAIRETYRLSGNPLYLGKVVSAFLACHPLAFFLLAGTLALVAADYLGKRLNRFLKNEG